MTNRSVPNSPLPSDQTILKPVQNKYWPHLDNGKAERWRLQQDRRQGDVNLHRLQPKAANQCEKASQIGDKEKMF